MLCCISGGGIPGCCAQFLVGFFLRAAYLRLVTGIVLCADGFLRRYYDGRFPLGRTGEKETAHAHDRYRVCNDGAGYVSGAVGTNLARVNRIGMKDSKK